MKKPKQRLPKITLRVEDSEIIAAIMAEMTHFADNDNLTNLQRLQAGIDNAQPGAYKLLVRALTIHEFEF